MPRPPPWLAAWGAPVAVFTAVAIVLFAPAAGGGKVLSGSDLLLFSPPFPPQPAGARYENQLQYDAAYVFEPDQLQVREALRSFSLPTWTSRLSAGRPLLAAQQSAPLFPLNWISSVLPYWESLVWVAVLKLVLAALGTFLLSRALGLGRAPGVLAGVAFGFGTYLVLWLSHPHVNAYLLLPWLFLFAERLCRDGRPADACGLAAFLGLAFLGGQPESGLIVAVPTAAWVAFRLVTLRRDWAVVARRALLAAGAAIVGAGLAAVMILPFLEALGESYMTSRGGGAALDPSAALSILFPEYWGRPDRAAVPLGPSNFGERTIYIGVLPAALALAGLVARRPGAPQIFFAGLLALALLAGFDTGAMSTAARDLPLLSQIAMNRVIVLATFAGAMLAAFGFEVVLRGSAAERRRAAAATAAAILVPGLVVLVVRHAWLAELGDGVRRMLGSGADPSEEVLGLAAILRWLVVGTLGVAAIGLLALRPRLGRWLVPVTVGIVCLDLVAMGYGYNPAIEKSQAEPPEPAAIGALKRLTPPEGRIGGDSALGPNTATKWGLADVRGHELPVVERHQKLWLAIGGGSGGQGLQRTRLQSGLPTPHLLLDLFSVNAVLLVNPAFAGLPVRYEGPDGIVVSNPTPFPRAFVAYGWRPSESLDESIARVAGGSRRQARDEPAIEHAKDPPGGVVPPATPARIESETQTSVELEAVASRPGRLVLLDTFYPGWHATVDGEATEIEPANAAFRAVEIPAGTHRVRFTYRPASVYVGGGLSVAALALLAGVLVLSRRRGAT